MPNDKRKLAITTWNPDLGEHKSNLLKAENVKKSSAGFEPVDKFINVNNYPTRPFMVESSATSIKTGTSISGSDRTFVFGNNIYEVIGGYELVHKNVLSTGAVDTNGDAINLQIMYQGNTTNNDGTGALTLGGSPAGINNKTVQYANFDLMYSDTAGTPINTEITLNSGKKFLDNPPDNGYYLIWPGYIAGGYQELFVVKASDLEKAGVSKTYTMYIDSRTMTIERTASSIKMTGVSTGGKRISRIAYVTMGNLTPFNGNTWETVEFNGDLIASNNTDNIKKLSLTSTSDFFTDLTDFKAKTIASVKNFLVAGNIDDVDGRATYKVRWSALANGTDWTTSAQTQSGFQNIASGGDIVKIVGGEFGLIFMENSIYRMTYVGSPLIFQFDQVEINRGCAIQQSVVKSGKAVYFFDSDGLYATSGTGQSTPIGYGKINKWFWDLYDPSGHMQSLSIKDEIYWSFTGKDGKRYILVYNESLNEFTTLMFPHSIIGDVITPTRTIDQLTGNLDTDYTTSFDNLPEGKPVVVAVNKGKFMSQNPLDKFKSSLKTGFLDTSDIRMVLELDIIHDKRPTSLTGQVETKLYSDSTPTKSIKQNSHSQTGRIPQRANGRYHSFEIDFEGDFGSFDEMIVTLNGSAKR